MTTLDRRDRRRALRVVLKMWTEFGTAGPIFKQAAIVSLIASALKREREETGMGAINWFLFSKGNTAKAKREIAQKYCTRKHVERGKA